MSSKRLCLAAAAALTLLISGCSMGFTNLKPGENSIYYTSLFHDIINTYDEPYWLWIRGTIALDYNGDGKVEEEAVIATIQKGSERRPGPIESAYLLICRVAPNGQRTALARTLLFDQSPFANAPRPVNDLGNIADVPLTRARAQVVEDKTTFKEAVVVYFSGDASPGSVWYAGFNFDQGRLSKNFEVAMWQSTPGFVVVNLTKSIDDSPFGYQLAFSVAAIPPSVMAKIDDVRETPLWGHIYARDADGQYKQADERFSSHYDQVENVWNQVYLKAVLQNLPAPDLAWFEYHLGVLNFYRGDKDMASRLLAKAAKGAEDERLRAGIDDALLMLDSADATAWTLEHEDATAVSTAAANGR